MKYRIPAFLLAVLLLTGCSLLPAQETQPAAIATLPTTVPTEPPVETTEAPTTVPTEPPIVEQARATVTVTGDLLMHMALIRAGSAGSGYDFSRFFSYTQPYIEAADFAVANLETTLAGSSYPYSGYPRFNCPDAIAESVKGAGFDLLLTANNHSNDTDALGILRTQEVVRDSGLLHLGTTLSEEDPKWHIQDLNGIQVGMVCYTYGNISAETGRKSVNGLPVSGELTDRINVFDYNALDRFYGEMESLLATMEAEGAEATVVFIHWGNEYELTQNGYQEAIAQKLCDLGVDVIIGGHPHVIQPVAMLTSTVNPDHQTFCAYSTGNCLSNQRAESMRLNTGHTEDAMFVSFTFVEYSNGVVALESARILPAWLCKRNGTFDLLPLDTEISDWQTAFDLPDWITDLAKASYDRTVAIVGPGMEQVTAALEENRFRREVEFDISVG